MAKQPAYTWAFAARFRSGAFGWKGSALACQRIKEALAEIRGVARRDPVLAAEGAVRMMEKLWPALQHVDSSSGALGNASYGAVETLTDLVAQAPADAATRRRWLERLWVAILDDGVSYLQGLTDRWGEVCASPEIANEWAERLLPMVREWLPQPGYVTGSTACFSCLLAAGRYQEVLDLVALDHHKWWSSPRNGVLALEANGPPHDAKPKAQASQGLNDSPRPVAAECERVLLAQGRDDEAYRRFALTANAGTTNLATFRLIHKKYPGVPAETILQHLIAASPGREGKWFATAKDLRFYDLALHLAEQSPTDPKTLNRAARDFAAREPRFAVGAALASLRWIIAGEGYEITNADLLAACNLALDAAGPLGETDAVRARVRALIDGGGNWASVARQVLGSRL